MNSNNIMSSNREVTDYTDFIPANLKFGKVEENERSKGQLLSYSNYTDSEGNEKPLQLQLPWIKLYTYGVPRVSEYYPTDDKRSHLRIPLDLSIDSISDFASKIKQLDPSGNFEASSNALT